MRKTIKIADTRTEYYCDLCHNEIEGYTSYGSPTYPDELIKVCAFCGKDTCPECRSEVCGWYMCKNCQEKHREILGGIAVIEGDYKEKREGYFQVIRSLIKSI